MFTCIETYSPTVIETGAMLVASLVRPWDQGRNADIALAGRCLR